MLGGLNDFKTLNNQKVRIDNNSSERTTEEVIMKFNELLKRKTHIQEVYGEEGRH